MLQHPSNKPGGGSISCPSNRRPSLSPESGKCSCSANILQTSPLPPHHTRRLPPTSARVKSRNALGATPSMTATKERVSKSVGAGRESTVGASQQSEWSVQFASRPPYSKNSSDCDNHQSSDPPRAPYPNFQILVLQGFEHVNDFQKMKPMLVSIDFCCFQLLC